MAATVPDASARSVMERLQEEFPFLSHVLVGQESEIGPMISREPASDVLNSVAEMGHSGNFPREIPLEAVGAALWRICKNAPDADYDGLSKIVKGWQTASLFARFSA